MDQLENILVGVELHPRTQEVTVGSAKAVEQAAWLATRARASLTIVHSTYTDDFRESLARGVNLVHEGLSDEGMKILEDLRTKLAMRGVACRLEVVDERPWRALTNAVLRREGDLVVVGKRDEEVREGRRLGSVAVKLLRKCPAPVWVVKPEHDLIHKLVLAATDLTPVGDRAVAYAAYVANQHDCDLHVVHAYRIPMSLQMQADHLTDEEYAEQVDSIKRTAQEHIEGVLAKSPRDGAEVHVGRNSASAGIREAVEHLQPDLLVMGTVSRGGLAGFLVGNTAERLLDRVDCSILAVKPDDFVCPVTLG